MTGAVEAAEQLLQIIRQGFPCLFQRITGLYCPGCGGTRAFKALLSGDILLSFCYHPLVPYAAAVILVWSACYLLSRALKNPGLYPGHENWLIYGGTAIVILNWIYKNYMLAVKGTDLLAGLS